MLPIIAIVFMFNTSHFMTGFKVVGQYTDRSECTIAIKQALPSVEKVAATDSKMYHRIWGLCLSDNPAFHIRLPVVKQ